MNETKDAVLTRQTQNIYDFSLATNGDILTDSFFDTSILVSLFRITALTILSLFSVTITCLGDSGVIKG